MPRSGCGLCLDSVRSTLPLTRLVEGGNDRVPARRRARASPPTCSSSSRSVRRCGSASSSRATSCRRRSRSSASWRSTRTRCSRPTATSNARAWCAPGPGQGTFVIGTLPRPTRPRKHGSSPSMSAGCAKARARRARRPTTSRRSSATAFRNCFAEEGVSMSDVIESDRPRQALRTPVGAPRLHARDPRGQGRRARRAERRRQDDAAASRRRAARADDGHDRGPRRPARPTPGAARPRRLRRPGHADLRRACRSPSTSGWAST